MKHDYPAFRGPSSSTARWDAAREQGLRELYADGLSASQIAAELGGISRNAVIGKVHRLGLERRGRPIANPRPRAPRKCPSRLLAFGGGALFNAPRAPVPPPEPVPEISDADIPLAQRRTLHELTPRSCRWPVGDPQRADFFFCGGDIVEGCPYCAGHVERAGAGCGPRLSQRRLDYLAGT